MRLIGVVCWIVLLILLTFRGIQYFIKNILPKQNFQNVFRDFKQKMWMTGGLGLTFLALYLSFVFFGSWFLTPEKKQQFFLLVYNSPVKYVYAGLLVFVIFSLSIYLVRMLIKYLYNIYIK
jgi:hypothetical protein